MTTRRKAIVALVTAALLVALSANAAWAPVGAKRKAPVPTTATR